MKKKVPYSGKKWQKGHLLVKKKKKMKKQQQVPNIKMKVKVKSLSPVRFFATP